MTHTAHSTSLAFVSTALGGEPKDACPSAGDSIRIPLAAEITSPKGRNSHPSAAELEQLLSRLRQLDDDELRHLALQATRLEQYAFRLRGAIASEIRRRVALRLSGGRGRRDSDGKGVRACLRRLADEIGVSVVTLTTDARIYDAFFTRDGETVIAREHSLPREYYVIALAAPDPIAAVRMAEERAADNVCTREQFRRHVLELKRAAHGQAVDVSTTEAPANIARTAALSRQQVRLTGEARHVLNELLKVSDCTAEQIVADALIARYHALTESTYIATTTTKSHALRRGRRTPTDDDESRPAQPSLLG
jgi:hypothetical protein